MLGERQESVNFSVALRSSSSVASSDVPPASVVLRIFIVLTCTQILGILGILCLNLLTGGLLFELKVREEFVDIN